ncbi:LacI family DNA-binding transcriptional regulator [Histidinibacterium aquaticum]|uniref:LacI family transcriptional regulator n=1 Tax=Histidinibacterium aquaticum TaxID=2613962 RepID=A0A5J5GCM8_9RHOB|nr:substrate-binding domain-containing protein [Histidinibacterium aquaticum]KAA9005552.1 LacI family transcriptional regulator [Histidinibacterium aquaticum]
MGVPTCSIRPPRMDGVILVAPRLAADVLAGYARQIPSVVIGHHEPTADAFDTVNSDDEQGARLSVRHLIDRGYEDIWMLTAPGRPGGYEVYDRREAGYRAEMQEAGLEGRVQVVRSDSETGSNLAELSELLRDLPKPGAVFCWSDIHAIPLLTLARDEGYEVPEEVAVVGYDNTHVGALPPIKLSSVDQHGVEIGRRAAATLQRRIRGETTGEHLLIQPELVLRASG